MNSEITSRAPPPSRTELQSVLEEILDASIVITGADYGNMQMVDAEGANLEIVAQRGFEREFLDHFKQVPLNHTSTSCGRAAETGKREMIRDAETDPLFSEHLDIIRKVPFHAVQSTPLLNRRGKLLGMLSTHFKRARLPDEKHLHMLDLYALQAAHVIELMQEKDPPVDDPPATAQHSAPTLDLNKKLFLQTISVLPFFADLTDKEKMELMRVSRFRHFRRGEMIFRIGDPVTHLNWVCAGAVQKYRETPDGREMTSAIRIVGDVLFDYDATQQKRVRIMNAKAIQSTTLLTVPAPWIDEHLKDWDHLMNKFMEMLAQRAQEAQIEIEHQATFNAAQIIACFLQNLCVTHHLDPRGFTLPYTKSLIASRLGMELESLSRVLPKLREFGIVVSGKQVSFTDIASAQNYSCGHCSVQEDCPTHQAMRKLAESPSARKKLEAAD